ncbi:putative exported protein [Burkholderia pseudomallei 1710b]|nr:putative exported protein [Burkholderia pseudomallei 1710b]
MHRLRSTDADACADAAGRKGVDARTHANGAWATTHAGKLSSSVIAHRTRSTSRERPRRFAMSRRACATLARRCDVSIESRHARPIETRNARANRHDARTRCVARGGRACGCRVRRDPAPHVMSRSPRMFEREALPTSRAPIVPSSRQFNSRHRHLSPRRTLLKYSLSRTASRHAHRIDRSHIMKRSSLLAFAAIALAVAAPAFADGGIGPAGGYGDASGHGHGARTRAEVRAELEQAQRDGTLAALRKSMSYAPPGAELGAPRPYRPDPDTNQLAGAGR